MKFIYIIVTILIIGGCAYYPKKIEIYESDCNIKYKKLILKKDKSNMLLKNCKNEGCITSLLTIPMQALVAGSIVVAGNIVFWLEKEGTCLLKDEL